MVSIRRIVLDVQKPHDPPIVFWAKELANIKGVDGVNIAIFEIDRQVENVKLTIEGQNIPYEIIKKYIESQGGIIHSLDEVAAGKAIVEEVKTLQW
ncbi:MAG: DUF211 domain-containing protein [Promethearchaeota archaeon]